MFGEFFFWRGIKLLRGRCSGGFCGFCVFVF